MGSGKGKAKRVMNTSIKTKETKQVLPIDKLGQEIRKNLTDDLLKPEYLNNKNPYAGHCYVASETYYHLMGGKEAGYKPVGITHEGSSHWWIEDKNGNIIDLTAEQFKMPVPYELGKGRGFLTSEPSKRSQVVIDRINS